MHQNRSFPKSGLMRKTAFLSLSLYALLIFSPSLSTAESDFRKRFVSYYRTIQFKALEALIKRNLDLIPGEVEALVKEAKEQGRGFEEKMYLLNLANKMALFYKDHRTGIEGTLSQLTRYQKELVKEDEAKTARMMKWKKLERVPGNFVMKKNKKAMEKEGLKPVIFPHWVHRAWYSCKVCHDKIFLPKKWANNLSMEEIKKGEQCGRCHNGKTAFAVEKNYIKCHMAGLPEGEHLHQLKKVNHQKIAATAKRIGARWNWEKLEDGALPVDKFGFMDWIALRDLGIFHPIDSLEKEAPKGEVRDNQILFVTQSPRMENTLFRHKDHSLWIDCSTCHPILFKKELGANEIKMRDMADGRFCGYCHGKVSFKFSLCKKCHSVPKGVTVEGALIRSGPKEP